MRNIFLALNFSIISILGVSPYIGNNINNNQVSTKALSYQTDKVNSSVENIFKAINDKAQKSNNFQYWMNGNPKTGIELQVKRFYNQYVNQGYGVFNSHNKFLLREEQIKDSKSYFPNSTNIDQTFATDEYATKYTNTHQYSVQLVEKINIGVSLNFIVKDEGNGGGSINVEFSRQRQWTDTIATEKTLTYKSQNIKVSAKKTGVVSYKVKKQTFLNKGVVSIGINANDILFYSEPYASKLNPDYYVSDQYKIKNLIALMGESINKKTLLPNSEAFSVLTVDNLEAPNVVWFNLPAQWENEKTILNVDFSEF